MKNMINKKAFSIVIGVLLTGFIIGTFFDYQISAALFSRNNGFGLFMAAVGEWPGYAMLSFFGGFTFMLAFKYYRKYIYGIGLMVGSVIAFGCASYFLGKAVFSVNAYNMPEKTLTLGLLIGVLTMIPPLLAGGYFGFKAINKDLWKISFSVLLTIAVAIGIVTIVKHIPHRPRFRLVTSNSEVDFYPWYIINKDYDHFVKDLMIGKEEFKSFPSGHIGISAAMFLSVYIPTLLEMKKPEKIRNIFFYVSCVYILLLAYTRILVGAHYLSDVCGGGIITISSDLVLVFILDKYTKQFETNEEDKEKSLSE